MVKKYYHCVRVPVKDLFEMGQHDHPIGCATLQRSIYMDLDPPRVQFDSLSFELRVALLHHATWQVRFPGISNAIYMFGLLGSYL